jgi:cytochrome c5
LPGAIGLSLLLTIIVSGCKPSSPAAERSPGEQAFKSKCQTCHRLPKADTKSVAQWNEWLGKHRTKAGLSDSETGLILGHLTGSSNP